VFRAHVGPLSFSGCSHYSIRIFACAFLLKSISIHTLTVTGEINLTHQQKGITMTLLTQKLSKPLFAEALRVVTLALFVIVFAAGVALAQTKGRVTNSREKIVPTTKPAIKTATAGDEQVSFTATGTGVITGVMHLPGGLTQLNVNTSGNATHLGTFTGPLTRIQDQGNFGSTAVITSSNGKDRVFLSVNGTFDRTKDKCVLTSTGTYIVTGGAGAFANATGSGTISTETDVCAGTATGTYTGTISKPNTN